MLTFLLVIVAIVIAGIIAVDKQKKENAAKIAKEEEKEIKRKLREHEINSVKEFAKQHRKNIEQLLERRQEAYNMAARSYLGALLPVLKPGKAEGMGIGIYYAKKINEEREEDYKRAKEAHDMAVIKGSSYKREILDIEKQIIDKLGEVSGSEQYIKILEKYFEEDKALFNIK